MTAISTPCWAPTSLGSAGICQKQSSGADSSSHLGNSQPFLHQDVPVVQIEAESPIQKARGRRGRRGVNSYSRQGSPGLVTRGKNSKSSRSFDLWPQVGAVGVELCGSRAHHSQRLVDVWEWQCWKKTGYVPQTPLVLSQPPPATELHFLLKGILSNSRLPKQNWEETGRTVTLSLPCIAFPAELYYLLERVIPYGPPMLDWV